MRLWPFTKREEKAFPVSQVPSLFSIDMGGWSDWFARPSFDASERPAWENTTLLACIKWACRVFPESDCYIQRRATDGTTEQVWDFPMLALMKRPNPAYSGRLLWAATITSLMCADQAFWLKVRAGNGAPVQLWYLPEHLVRPIRLRNYVDYYEYDTGNQTLRFEPKDIVHFRDGIDPDATHRGLRKLGALGDEILTDNEASAFSYRLLRNMGIIPYVISPEGMTEPIGEESAKEMQRRIMEHGGRGRGKPLIPHFPIKVQKLGASPEEMALDKIRRWPQDKVCSVVGINPMVLGLPSESKTFSNFGEAREAAMEEYVLPTQRLLCDEIDSQLLPDFTNDATLTLRFDLSQVRVLQEDRDKAHARVREDWKADLIDREEARSETNRKGRPEDKGVYYSMIAGKAGATDPNQDDPNATDGESQTIKAFKAELAKKWQERAAS